jgi:CHASE1-domain containing sensor protein
MGTFLSIILGVAFLVLVLIALSSLVTGIRSRPTHEEVRKRFVYRAEPHADQVTRQPNRLSDNEITKG